MNFRAQISNCNQETRHRNKIECLSKYYVQCLEYVDKSKNKQITNKICDIFVSESTNNHINMDGFLDK